jgi:kynurenine formamidase
VHRLLLIEHGIYIIEHLNLEAAAGERLTEFLFVLAPLRITGGTGSPVRPLAVVGAPQAPPGPAQPDNQAGYPRPAAS